jgi:peptidoglycan/LPS O-acetylase OafA/YrhL
MTDRRYMSQLDALRCFAVLAVLFAHYWRPDPHTWIIGRLPWGELGVRLFFVLSGFLITRILLGGRELGERSPERRLYFLRQFYVRRFLRIFPIYYLVLVAALIVGVGPARQIWPWLFTYTTNLYIWYNRDWIGSLGPLWSLAVEEQFYLAWPWLLLFLPRRWLVPSLLLFVCLGPMYRLYASYHYPSDMVRGQFTSFALTPAVVDGLAIGALLAILTRAGRDSDRFRQSLRRVILPVGLLGYAILLVLAGYGIDYHAMLALGHTAQAFVFCWLVDAASRGFGGSAGRLLEWRPIVYLGKISYGIYLFHYFVPPALSKAAAWLGVDYRQRGSLNFLVASLVTVAIASLSWRLFEGPINDLKRHFSYDAEPIVRSPTVLAPTGQPIRAEPAAQGSDGGFKRAV